MIRPSGKTEFGEYENGVTLAESDLQLASPQFKISRCDLEERFNGWYLTYPGRLSLIVCPGKRIKTSLRPPSRFVDLKGNQSMLVDVSVNLPYDVIFEVSMMAESIEIVQLELSFR